jgi:hypothetical protein
MPSLCRAEVRRARRRLLRQSVLPYGGETLIDAFPQRKRRPFACVVKGRSILDYEAAIAALELAVCHEDFFALESDNNTIAVHTWPVFGCSADAQDKKLLLKLA